MCNESRSGRPKSSCEIFVLLAFLMLLTSASTQGQKPKPSATDTPKYDLQTEAKFKGTVEELKQPPKGSGKEITHLLVKSATDTFDIYLCPQSFFDAIPKDLEEAAMIDGCSRFQALRRVILPLTLPGMGATLGFVFTAAWSELLFALMLISGADSSTFPVGLLSFVSKFSVDFGQMTAAGMLALIPVCIFFFLIQRHLVRGLTAGAVKG